MATKGTFSFPYAAGGDTKEILFDAIAKILKNDNDLEFLLKLAPRELAILLVSLKDLTDRRKNEP